MGSPPSPMLQSGVSLAAKPTTTLAGEAVEERLCCPGPYLEMPGGDPEHWGHTPWLWVYAEIDMSGALRLGSTVGERSQTRREVFP